MDDQKLRSFTRPLVGYELTGRVPVTLQTVNPIFRRSHSPIDNTAIYSLPSAVMPPGQLSIRTLRETASDLHPSKPTWDKSKKAQRRSVLTSPKMGFSRERVFQSEGMLDTTRDDDSSSSPSRKTMTSYGVIGHGRFPASFPVFPCSNGLMITTEYVERQANDQWNENLMSSRPQFSDLPAGNSFRTGLSSMSLGIDNTTSSFARQYGASGSSLFLVSDRVRPGMRRLSFGDAHPPPVKDMTPSVSRRISRPAIPIIVSSPGKNITGYIPRPIDQNHSSVQTISPFLMTPYVLKQEASLGLSGPRVDWTETDHGELSSKFTLPPGVRQNLMIYFQLFLMLTFMLSRLC